MTRLLWTLVLACSLIAGGALAKPPRKGKHPAPRKIEQPKTEQPESEPEAPKSESEPEAPKSEEPKPEEPKSEPAEPKSEEPSAESEPEEPTPEEPKSEPEEPKPEVPKSEEPKSEPEPEEPKSEPEPKPAPPKPPVRPRVGVEKLSFMGGEVPRAAKALSGTKARVEKCVVEHGGLDSDGYLEMQFLVRTRQRAEGVEVTSRKGVSAEAGRCVQRMLKGWRIGVPTGDPVGVAFRYKLLER